MEEFLMGPLQDLLEAHARASLKTAQCPDEKDLEPLIVARFEGLSRELRDHFMQCMWCKRIVVEARNARGLH